MRNLAGILKKDQWAEEVDIGINVTSDISGVANWSFGEIR
jgi:hypothetical protein